MKYLFLGIFCCIGVSVFGQRFFYEDFEYPDFETLDRIFKENPRKYIWSTIHADDEVDISGNGVIDSTERFKKSSIVADPMNPANSVLRLELNRASPYLYSKYSCDNDRKDNVVPDSLLELRYDMEKELYCLDCSESPKGVRYTQWNIHMIRNELSTAGRNAKLYKPNRDYWFGMRMMIGLEHELDTVRNGEIVAQFHLTDYGATRPPVALMIVEGRFRLVVVNNKEGKSDVYDLGRVIKGQWNEWKFHMVLSKREEKGIFEIWRNGKKMHTILGKNILKNRRTYLKIGIYKWGWWNCDAPLSHTRKKVVYYDNIWAAKLDGQRLLNVFLM